jgi:phosphatidylserine decarboxylase
VGQSDGTRIERNYIYNLSCTCRNISGVNTFAGLNTEVKDLVIHENRFQNISNQNEGNANALAAVAGTNAGSITFTSNEVIKTKVGFNLNPDVAPGSMFTIRGNSFGEMAFAAILLIKAPGAPIANNTSPRR